VVYSQDLLNLPKDDRHFLLHLPMTDRHFSYKQKFLKKTPFWRVELGKSVGFHVSSTVMTGFQWIVHWWVLTTHYSLLTILFF
jgi:hypothetical protein